MKIKTGVVGAPIPSVRELLRILPSHPRVDLVHLHAEEAEREGLGALAGELSGLPPVSTLDVKALAADCHAVFLALPNALEEDDLPGKLVAAGLHVFDLFADYRFRARGSYSRVFRKEHANREVQLSSAYGLPELFRPQIRGVRLTALPAAVPTAVILALAPLARHDILQPGRIVADCKTAVTGAFNMTRDAPPYMDLNENIVSHGALALHHRTEIEEQLSQLMGESQCVTFAETIVPADRGVLATCFATLREPLSAEDLHRLYERFYEGEAFVRILAPGTHASTKRLLGSNVCEISLEVDERCQRLILTSALDNLGKGTAGQAVQAFNANYGIDETLGLLPSSGRVGAEVVSEA